jgi:hypothetical protein
MRSIVIVGLLVFIGVLAGGWGISWYAQASATRDAIEKTIARINANQQFITYEAIETSGFPTNVYVSIIKPRFTGRIDELFKGLKQPQPTTATDPVTGQPVAQPVPLSNLPEWHEDILLNGQLTLGINALSNQYTLHTKGDWVTNSHIGGQAFNVTHQQAGDTYCSLQMQRTGSIFSSLWNFESLSRDGQSYVQDFRMLDCILPGSNMINEATKERLGGSGAMRFYITSLPMGENHQLRFYVTAADIEISPQGDVLMSAYFNALNPHNRFQRSFSAYGKQNINIDFSYNGPADLKNKGNNPNIDIALSPFSITNDVYTQNLSVYVNNKTLEQARESKVAFRADTKVSDKYDMLIQEWLEAFIADVYNSDDPQLLPLKAQMQRYPMEQLYPIIYPAIPNFYSLGNIVQAVDLSYNGNPDLTAGNVTLTDFDISFTPYGIKGSGYAKLEAAQPPTSEVLLTCTNCFQMIDDAVAYTGRVQQMMMYFSPEQAAMLTVSPELVDGVKSFLRLVAGVPKEQAAQEMQYTINSAGPAGITINGRPIAQVVSMYNDYIRPALKPRPARPVR